MFPLQDLVSAQSGWRWITSKSGEIVEDLTFWNRAWVVIGDKDGDAIFVDTNNGRVFGSIQKRNFPITQTLASFFDSLTVVMSIEMDKYDFEVLDDEMNLLPEFLTDLKTEIAKKSNSEEVSGFMKFFFG